MRYLWVGILIAVMVDGLQVARADCPGANLTYELDVYRDTIGGEAINYELYLKDGVDYELSVTYMDWWRTRFSSFDTWDSYPAHWWMYDSSECGGELFEEGDGDRSSLENQNGSYNDRVDSLKFRCPSNKDRTTLTFFVDEDYGGTSHPLGLYKHGNSKEVVVEMPRLDAHWNDQISRIDTNRNGSSTKHYHWYFYKNANFNDNGNPDLILSDGDDTSDLGALEDKITSYRLVITDSATPPTISGAPTLPVPTLSEWGLIVLVLLLLASGTVILLRRRMMASHSCPN